MTTCPDCGHQNASSAKFCQECGRKVTSGSVTAPALGENRLVTVLFADMAGSVRATAGLSGEDAARKVNELLSDMAAAVHKHEGRIDRYLGDGLLATFGTPIAREDDAERAVETARMIRDAAKIKGFGTSCGVNTGEVYYGRIGSDAHGETSVMGPVVNLAARLQSQAGTDGILVGPATRRLAQRFDYEPLRLTIKGLAEPVDAFRLVGEAGVRVRSNEAHFVGRAQELIDVLTPIRNAAAGRGHIILIEAEPGIGKSRLVREVKAEATAFGHRWWEAQCRRGRQATAYSAWKELLSSALGTDNGNSVPDQLVGGAHWRPQERDDATPWLAAVAGTGTAPALDPEQTRSRTFVSLRTFFAACARQKRTILVVEDLHWADPLTVDLLRSAAEEFVRAGVIVIVTTRPTETPFNIAATKWDDHVTHVKLRELAAHHAPDLVRSLLGGPADASLITAIAKRSQGIPLFAEELVRALRDQGAIAATNGTWKLTIPLEKAALPEGLQALIQSRVDTLAKEDRHIVQYAAVVGSIFSPRLLERLLRNGTRAGLERARQHGIVEPLNDDEWTFRHALIQETIYRGMLRPARAELHQEVAIALEAAHPDSPRTAVPEQIGHHFEQGTEPMRALPYLVQAGNAALARYDNVSAKQLFQRSTDLSNTSAAPANLASFSREGLADALTALGEPRPGRDLYESALALAFKRNPAEQVRILRKRAEANFLARDHERYEAYYEDARRAAEAAPSFPGVAEEVASLELQYTWTAYFLNRLDRYLPILERARKQVGPHAPKRQQARLVIAEILFRLRRDRYVFPPDVMELYDQAVALAHGDVDLSTLAFAYFARGFGRLFKGDLDGAERDFDETLALCRRCGDLVVALRCKVYVTLLEHARGNVDQAERLATSTLQEAEQRKFTEYIGAMTAVLAWVRWKQGDLQEAKKRIEQARAESEKTDSLRYPFGWVHEAVALEIAITEKDLDGARVAAATMIRADQQRPSADTEATIQAALAARDRDQAWKLFRELARFNRRDRRI